MPEPRIRILPPEVAERIAAGEVVERPASAVKELVENALDAGARRIVVETEAGGKVLFRVTDDGNGMTPEELLLAVQRHATSKLHTAEDLFNIHTLGFRGEALASIAAVSEMEILSRTPDATEGARLLMEGGMVRAHEAASAPVGTRITVRRLFYNLPVREKFLRSDVAEAGQITDWLQRLALAHGEVSFRLVHQGREALLSPGSQDPLNAVVAILGRGVAREMLRIPPVERETAAVTVRGFVGRPTLTRANRALQQVFVNGRSVRSPLFYRALDDAYRATMPSGRHPAAVLFLTVAPEFVDVNVHPAKTEVRFQDEGEVQSALVRAIRAALATGVDSQTADQRLDEPYPVLDGPSPDASRVAEPGALPFADLAIDGRHPTRPPINRTPIGGWADVNRRWDRELPSAPSPEAGLPPVMRQPDAPRPESSDRAAPIAGPRLPELDALPPEFGDSRPPQVERLQSPPLSPSNTAISELRLLGQAQDLFILAEAEGQLWVIDQHVAHERVLFDRMIDAQGAGDAAEPLLIPATLTLDQGHSLALTEHRELLGQLGFVVDPFGTGRWQLRAVPRGLLGRDYERAFRDLADELAERTQNGQNRLRLDELAVVAAGRSCKRAVKAGQRLSTTEIERLLAELREARNPHTCPHGRPVFLTFSEDEIASLFGDKDCG